MDRAAHDEKVIDALSTIHARVKDSEIIVPPTVIQELFHVSKTSPNPYRRKLANTVLEKMLEWGFQPLNLVPVSHGIVEIIAHKISEKRLLPATEKNDSLILAESSLIGASVLLTSDKHLLGIDQDKLKFFLTSQDVTTPIIVSPFHIVKKFF